MEEFKPGTPVEAVEDLQCSTVGSNFFPQVVEIQKGTAGVVVATRGPLLEVKFVHATRKYVHLLVEPKQVEIRP